MGEGKIRITGEGRDDGCVGVHLETHGPGPIPGSARRAHRCSSLLAQAQHGAILPRWPVEADVTPQAVLGVALCRAPRIYTVPLPTCPNDQN